MPGVAPEQLLKSTDFTTSRPTERASFLVLPYINIDPILFLDRLGFLRRTGCVPHYFQYKDVAIFILSPNSQSQILNYQVINICRVL